MLAQPTATTVDRRFRVVLLDLATGRSWDTVVSATTRSVVSQPRARPAARRPAADHRHRVRDHRGRPQRRAGAGSPRWNAAASSRPSVRAVPLSAGVYDDYPDEAGPPDRARVRLPPGPREGPPLGAPDRRARRLRRPHRAHGRPGRSTPASSPVPETAGNFDDPERAGPAARLAQADRDHPARGPLVHRRGRARALGEVGPADRVQRARGPDPAPDRVRRAADLLPRVGRRDGGALRRPGAGAVLAELLRLRRVHVRPLRRLAAAGLRLPRRHPLHRRRDRRRPRQPEDDHQRDLHARGGLRGALEALRPVHRLARGAPPAPPGDLVLHPDRQLRLRLLLVPLPRRHHPARGQGHRHRVHLRHPAASTPPRSRPVSARRSTSTCSPRGWT